MRGFTGSVPRAGTRSWLGAGQGDEALVVQGELGGAAGYGNGVQRLHVAREPSVTVG